MKLECVVIACHNRAVNTSLLLAHCRPSRHQKGLGLALSLPLGFESWFFEEGEVIGQSEIGGGLRLDHLLIQKKVKGFVVNQTLNILPRNRFKWARSSVWESAAFARRRPRVQIPVGPSLFLYNK